MPPFVNLFVVGNGDFAMAPCRNDSRRAAVLQGLAEVIDIEGLVSQQGVEHQAVNQIWSADNLATLAGKQYETNQIAQGIGERQHLGRQSPF